MRDLNDITLVRFDMTGSVELDLERVEEDPAWQNVSMKYDLRDLEQKAEALAEYLRHYLTRETLLANTPSTSGPATIYGVNAVVVKPTPK